MDIRNKNSSQVNVKMNTWELHACIRFRDAFNLSREGDKTANLFGEWVDKLYVVYSYRRSYPLAVWCPYTGWRLSSTSASVTTSQHLGQVRRALDGCNVQYATSEELLEILRA